MVVSELDILTDPIEYIPAFFKITTKADGNGISNLVPFEFKPCQLHYIKNRTHRDICVKGRQMGFSSGVLAANAHATFTTPYTRLIVVAHKAESSTFMLQTVHRFYNNLPTELQPASDWKSASWIRFPKLDCFIHIDSAESKTIGRSENITWAHLSEIAQYPELNATELHAGISQTVPLGGYITYESTPRGRGGWFYRFYQAAKKGDVPYKAFFYPWWWEPEYKLPLDRPLELTKDEELMISTYNLTQEQIAWRRLKIAELGDLFFQEYPENDVDCWLSSDINVFDGVIIRNALRSVKPPIQTDGHLLIWKRPVGGIRYIIGVDVGGGLANGDYSAACVVNYKTMEHVATLRGRIPPDLFAQELIRLQRMYNDATLAVERAQHGHTVLDILLKNSVPNLYYHCEYYENTLTIDISRSQPGWDTSGKSRPVMIDTMRKSIASGDLTTYSENLLNEAASFIYVGQRAEAPAGEHDDELFAMMIALCVRENTPILSEKRSRPSFYARS